MSLFYIWPSLKLLQRTRRKWKCTCKHSCQPDGTCGALALVGLFTHKGKYCDSPASPLVLSLCLSQYCGRIGNSSKRWNPDKSQQGWQGSSWFSSSFIQKQRLNFNFPKTVFNGGALLLLIVSSHHSAFRIQFNSITCPNYRLSGIAKTRLCPAATPMYCGKTETTSHKYTKPIQQTKLNCNGSLKRIRSCSVVLHL